MLGFGSSFISSNVGVLGGEFFACSVGLSSSSISIKQENNERDRQETKYQGEQGTKHRRDDPLANANVLTYYC